MSGADRYLEQVGAMIQRLRSEQLQQIQRAAGMVAGVLREDGLVHIFGTGHSHMLAEEGLYRTGGLAPINAILEPALMLHEGATASTEMERLSGYSRIVANKHDFREGDLLVVVSNSGVNAVPVEMALLARLPVYRSSNMPGAPEHNRHLIERFRGRVKHL